MTDQSKKFNLKMLEDMIDATSSQESDCGITLCNLLDGMMNDQSGPDHAPANPFLLPDDKKLKQMIATYGPNGSGSSRSAALQKSLESKLQARLPTGGLTMFIKGWSRRATPLGRLYFQLVASVRPIEGRDFGLWATPNTMDHLAERSYEAMKRQAKNGGRKGRTFPGNLREQVSPNMCQAYREAMIENGKTPAMWPTALWLTPRANEIVEPAGQAAKRLGDRRPETACSLGEQVVSAALWPTTNASDHRDRGSYNDPCIQRRVQMGKQVNLSMLAQGTGKMQCGSTVQTESKGSLNPEFPCWLMGIPNEWVSSIVQGMQSLPKSQRNSSSLPNLEDMF